MTQMGEDGAWTWEWGDNGVWGEVDALWLYFRNRANRVAMGRVREMSQGVLQGFGLSNGRTELPLIKTGRTREEQAWGEDWALSSGR